MNRQSIWTYIVDKNYPKAERTTEFNDLIEVRYVLGETWNDTQKAFICIGLNPSTAIPKDLDPTVNAVSKHAHAKQSEYGAWYMLNLYPERTKSPERLPMAANLIINEINLNYIKEYINLHPESDILIAWGNEPSKKSREYLKTTAETILKMINPEHVFIWSGKNEKGETVGLTKENRPRHIRGRSITGAAPEKISLDLFKKIVP